MATALETVANGHHNEDRNGYHHDEDQHETMKAVYWEGNVGEVTVRRVPKARIQEPEDVVVRLTTAAICGTDLHVYHGTLFGTKVPYPLGHEGVGIIEEVGSAVDNFKKGDRVAILGGPDDDQLRVKAELLPSSRIYGLGNYLAPCKPHLGGLQAEYARIAKADNSLIKLEDNLLGDKEYLPLSDIFPTGWDALNMSGFQPGNSVAIFGAGPVGLMVAYSAIIRGASRVYSIDHIEERLRAAEKLGAIPIDFTRSDPVKQILAKEPNGITRVIDAIGVECLNERLELQQDYVINQAVKLASNQGGIGVIGVHGSQPVSEGTPQADLLKPTIKFPLPLMWQKGLVMQGGIVRFSDQLLATLFSLINSGKARPGFVFSSIINIDDAPEAYRRFNQGLETKVLIRFPGKDESPLMRENQYQPKKDERSCTGQIPGSSVW